MDPSIKFHCHIYNFFSYEAMTVEVGTWNISLFNRTVRSIVQQINTVDRSAAILYQNKQIRVVTYLNLITLVT